MSTDVTDDDRKKIKEVRRLLLEVSAILEELTIDSEVEVRQIDRHYIGRRYPFPVFEVLAKKVEYF